MILLKKITFKKDREYLYVHFGYKSVPNIPKCWHIAEKIHHKPGEKILEKENCEKLRRNITKYPDLYSMLKGTF